jgi:FixJ family two-component response regulator
MTNDAPMTARRPKLLLVEDDPAVRRSVHLLLQSTGYDIRAYANGTALLADPTAIEADGLVADYMVPDMDGIAILARLRAMGWTGPAILVTGFASPELAEQARAGGFAELVEKPLKGQRFAETVMRVVAAAAND